MVGPTSVVKSRYWRSTHKFGKRIPKSVGAAEAALEFDRLMGTDHWRRAIDKKMKNVRIMFEKWEDGDINEARSNKKLVGYQQEIPCHMRFDIKMDGQFMRKAWVVCCCRTYDCPANGHYVFKCCFQGQCEDCFFSSPL